VLPRKAPSQRCPCRIVTVPAPSGCPAPGKRGGLRGSDACPGAQSGGSCSCVAGAVRGARARSPGSRGVSGALRSLLDLPPGATACETDPDRPGSAGCAQRLPPALRLLLVTESQNGRGWKGPLWVTQPKPLPKQGHPQQAAQHRGQAGLEYLQRRRLHSFPGQPGPGLRHPQREEVLPCVQLELPLLQFVPVAPCPVAGHHCKELGPINYLQPASLPPRSSRHGNPPGAPRQGAAGLTSL